eukprot:CAMPEP_0119302656 /NCGR_PEP_ID=MMETSP1333-20130426/4219_1 /TAXON_ID=418940 /ORGANISM="Scyphosphaera apsteinii, Strain RCC1455" /LENGTH=273 /DNA_ID=CAMNT_0007305075 /DNA_START=141 /DNA_END=962 /DNA_ORIENTATION=-
MACRSSARGNAAAATLIASNPEWEDRLMVFEMDTSSDSSVGAAAASLETQLGKHPPPLYGIVNNAGIAAGSVADILDVNVRGPKRVDDAFLPLLDPERGRIVQMSSGAASGCVSRSSEQRRAFFTDSHVTWDQISSLLAEVEALPNGARDLEERGIGASMGVYGFSKACLNSYTILSAREHPHLKVNACSPGMIATDIMGCFLPWWVPIPNAAVQWLATKVMGAKSPDEGTVSTMHLLFSQDLSGNGRYYGSDAKRSPLDTYRSPGSPPYEGP